MAVTVGDIETVLAGYAAIDARNAEAVFALLAPDPVLETRVETYRGLEGLGDYYEQGFLSGFTGEHNVLLVLEDGVAGLSTIHLENPERGIETEDKVLELWEFEDHKIKKMRVISEREGLEELGLTGRAKRVQELRAGYDAFNRGDFDAVEAGLASDIRFDRGEMAMDTQVVEGSEQVRQFLEPDVFQDQQTEIEWIVDANEKVMVEAVFTARGSGSGIEMSTPTHQVWTRRSEKVARADSFQNRATALAFLLAPPG